MGESLTEMGETYGRNMGERLKEIWWDIWEKYGEKAFGNMVRNLVERQKNMVGHIGKIWEKGLKKYSEKYGENTKEI